MLRRYTFLLCYPLMAPSNERRSMIKLITLFFFFFFFFLVRNFLFFIFLLHSLMSSLSISCQATYQNTNKNSRRFVAVYHRDGTNLCINACSTLMLRSEFVDACVYGLLIRAIPDGKAIFLRLALYCVHSCPTFSKHCG